MFMNRQTLFLAITGVMFGLALLIVTAVPIAAAEGPLVSAVRSGDVQRVRTLLAGAADVQVTESDGMTPLHWAVQQDAVAMVDLLLAAGADASVSNHYGVTPLTLASINGSGDAVARLLDAGACLLYTSDAADE